MRNPLSFKKKLLFSSVTLLAAYGVAEIACTAIMPRPAGSIGSDTFAMQEDTGGYLLDAVRGYVVTKEPARFCRVTNGKIEFLGVLRGNSMGFQGDRDYSIKRPSGVYRDLVLGDSFTAEPFIDVPWPKRVEESQPNHEMMSCSLCGCGLANWWSVVTRFIVPRKYEFDRVVFASISGDMHRHFTVADYRCEGIVALGQMGWNPETFPKTSNRAFGYLNLPLWEKVTPDEFTMSLTEGRLCRGPNPHQLMHPYIASGVSRFISRTFFPPKRPIAGEWSLEAIPPLPKREATKSFGADQMAMICDMREKLRGVPIVVVYLPIRDEVLAKHDDSPIVREFAEHMHARFIDGSKPFRAMSDEEVRACYFPVDGHWNQAGSDRFAAFIADKLRGDK